MVESISDIICPEVLSAAHSLGSSKDCNGEDGSYHCIELDVVKFGCSNEFSGQKKIHSINGEPYSG